jgi:hypothetical protein
MLELRSCCEHCAKELPPDSTEAMICSFECTYCRECALILFENVCPSCGGNFHPRPIRPKVMLRKYPSSGKKVFEPKSDSLIQKMKSRYKGTPPEER